MLEELYKKICEIMCWAPIDGETYADVLLRKQVNINDIPCGEAIEIVHAGDLQQWAELQTVASQEELKELILYAVRKVISDPIFNDRKKCDNFPPLANFFYFCRGRLDRNGKLYQEAASIADLAWNGVICKRVTRERADESFKSPDVIKYASAVARIKSVYGYSDADIEALRYFVCQVRRKEHDPSKNKSIYHWGKAKQTGKTTVAKCIVSILNGDTLCNSHKYRSTLSQELQFGNHDIPKAALFECVLLDEAAPKDSTKSYNSFKSKLTDDGCSYNPKYKQQVNLKCKRFYYFTSNDDVTDFVQDEQERRILAIHAEREPQALTLDDVFSLWFDFCTNAEPESDFDKWYNSFNRVSGLASKEMNEALNEIMLRMDEVFPYNGKTYTTIKTVSDILHKNEPSREQKKVITAVMSKYFESCRAASNKSCYNIYKCRDRVEELRREMGAGDEMEDDNSLPF